MEQAIYLLLKYKYGVLFPLAIFAGPIVTVIATKHRNYGSNGIRTACNSGQCRCPCRIGA